MADNENFTDDESKGEETFNDFPLTEAQKIVKRNFLYDANDYIYQELANDTLEIRNLRKVLRAKKAEFDYYKPVLDPESTAARTREIQKLEQKLYHLVMENTRLNPLREDTAVEGLADSIFADLNVDGDEGDPKANEALAGEDGDSHADPN